LPVSHSTVAIQGFGNVGLHTALFLYEAGLKVVAVSDINTALYHPAGLNIPDLIAYYNSNNRSIAGYENAQTIEHDELLLLPLNVLIPAAKEDVITAANAPYIKASLIVEGANGPVASDADAILKDKNVTVVPDIVANAGGVTVSYFEWLQNSLNESWPIEQVNSRLNDILEQSFSDVFATATQYNVTLRIAAYVLAIKKVAQTYLVNKTVSNSVSFKQN